MAQHELHPLCTLFPRMAGAEFEGLKADIAANGLRHPIVLLDGMILDGGNRYRACIEADVAPSFTEYTGGNVASFVLSANMHRRHLSPGQQAAIVATVQSWTEAQPASRPKKAGNVAGLSTIADRAAQSGASERTQRMADKVAKADPALAREVAQGTVSLPRAVAQVDGKPDRPAPKPASGDAEKLQAENEELRAQLIEARDNARELAAMVESYDAVTAGDHAAAKEMAKLRGQLRTVEATRDQWMTTCGELRKEVKSLQRRLGASQ